MDGFMVDAGDGLPDDRVTCASCHQHTGKGSWCKRFMRSTDLGLPRRCYGYVPIKSERDQVPGAKRWPGLMPNIIEARALDREFARRRAR
jgi:hypothetical protein